jgi:hypothetical protein
MRKTSLVWFSYELDADMLQLSVVSASNVLKGEAAYHIFQDFEKPLPESTVSFFRQHMPWVNVHDRMISSHRGMYGKENIARILRIQQIAANMSRTIYATKIDSDCIMCDKKFLNFLSDNKYSFVGTSSGVGNWGAFYHVRIDVLNKMNSYDERDFNRIIEEHYIDTKIHHRDYTRLFGEDDVIPTIAENMFGNVFLDGNPLHGLDNEHFFECYYPHKHFGDIESLIDKYDVIEFGRRALTANFLKSPDMPWIDRKKWLYGQMCIAMNIINSRTNGDSI